MTVQIDVDKKMWAEAEKIAKDLKVDYSEMVMNAVRQSLYSLRDAKKKQIERAEKERRHRESYEKHPVQPEEFYVDDEQLIEAWKDL